MHCAVLTLHHDRRVGFNIGLRGLKQASERGARGLLSLPRRLVVLIVPIRRLMVVVGVGSTVVGHGDQIFVSNRLLNMLEVRLLGTSVIEHVA